MQPLFGGITRCSDRLRYLVLTGHDQNLSGAVNFNTVRSQSFLLARHDVSASEGASVIRVSWETAVRFIAELQRREARAFWSLKRDSPEHET